MDRSKALFAPEHPLGRRCRLLCFPPIDRVLGIFKGELRGHLPGPGPAHQEFREGILAQAIAAVLPGLSERRLRLCIHSFIGQLVHLLRIRSMARSSGRARSQPFGTEELLSHIVEFTAGGIRRLADMGDRT